MLLLLVLSSYSIQSMKEEGITHEPFAETSEHAPSSDEQAAIRSQAEIESHNEAAIKAINFSLKAAAPKSSGFSFFSKSEPESPVMNMDISGKGGLSFGKQDSSLASKSGSLADKNSVGGNKEVIKNQDGSEITVTTDANGRITHTDITHAPSTFLQTMGVMKPTTTSITHYSDGTHEATTTEPSLFKSGIPKKTIHNFDKSGNIKSSRVSTNDNFSILPKYGSTEISYDKNGNAHTEIKSNSSTSLLGGERTTRVTSSIDPNGAKTITNTIVN